MVEHFFSFVGVVGAKPRVWTQAFSKKVGFLVLFCFNLDSLSKLLGFSEWVQTLTLLPHPSKVLGLQVYTTVLCYNFNSYKFKKYMWPGRLAYWMAQFQMSHIFIDAFSM